MVEFATNYPSPESCRRPFLQGYQSIVLMPETAEEDAAKVAERLRERFQTEMLHLSQNEKAACTMSVGVTQYVPKEAELSVLKRVDKAMCLAKSRGKNQVCILPESADVLQ